MTKAEKAFDEFFNEDKGALIDAKSLSPSEVFTEDGAQKIVREVLAQAGNGKTLFDMNEKADRDACASLAYKVARSKTAIDNVGKEFVAEQKATIKKVDQARKFIRDNLDQIRDDIRKPLNQWEEKRKTFEHLIESTRALTDVVMTEDLTLDSVEQLQRKAEAFDPNSFPEDMRDSADHARVDAVRYLEGLARSVQKRDQERAELERLRKLEQEQKEKEEKARIEREAQERARIEAEERHKRELEQIKAEAEQAKREAEEAKQQAEQAAEREKEAREEERRNAALEQARKEEEEKRRKAEAERLAPDRETLYEYIKQLRLIICGTLTTDEGREELQRIETFLDESLIKFGFAEEME